MRDTVFATIVLQKVFMFGSSGDLEDAHANAAQLAREAIADVGVFSPLIQERKLLAFSSSTLKLHSGATLGRTKFLEVDMG